MHSLAIGFGVAFAPSNLVFALLGALLGSLVGALPGLGAITAIAILLPPVYSLDATPALILLAGVYLGAQYSGSTAAILLNVPGESTAQITAVEGHVMARQGRAGAALTAAGLGSFFAGCVGTLLVAAASSPLTELAFRFGPAEYFSLMVLGLVGSVVLASGALVKSLAMGVLGLLLSQASAIFLSGTTHFGIEVPALPESVGFVVLAMGLFGVGDIVVMLGMPSQPRELLAREVSGLWPTRQDLSDACPAVLRGTLLGSLMGVLPGGGAMLASVASYAIEKRWVDAPRIPFGKGAIQGVAGPESANNAGAQTSFIPMLALGIPPNAVMALMGGALMIKGIQPGPQVMTTQPQLFWGLIAAMWVINMALVVINVPLAGAWVRVLNVPYRFVFPALVLLCCIGAFTLQGHGEDVYLVAIFAVIGYVFHKLGCACAPLLLGFILGPIMEDNLRRALALSHGDWDTFVTKPISAGLLFAAGLLIVVARLPTMRGRRDLAFADE